MSNKRGKVVPIYTGILPRRLTFAEVRELEEGHVPKGCKKFDAWFDESDSSMCYFIGRNLEAMVVRVFLLRHGDIFFEEQMVAMPIKLWLKRRSSSDE